MTDSNRRDNNPVRLLKPTHKQLKDHLRDGETHTGAVGRALDALEAEQSAPAAVREQAHNQRPDTCAISARDGLHSVAQAVADLEQATTSEIVEHENVSIQAQQTRTHLSRLQSHGVVSPDHRGRGGRPIRWEDCGVERVTTPSRAGTTNVRLTVPTYERLDDAKEDYESFSDVLGRALDALEREDVVRELLAEGVEA